jgi:hypothetical protein
MILVCLVLSKMSSTISDDICKIKEIIESDLNKFREIKALVGDKLNSDYTEQIDKFEESIVKMYGDAERICETAKILFDAYEKNRVGFEEYFRLIGKLVTERATLWGDYKLKTSFMIEKLQSTLKTVSENNPRFSQEQIQEILAATKALKDYYKNSHAIIIGISEYKDENPLPNAYNDAKGIEKILRERYEFNDFFTLYNEKATKSNLEEIFVDKFRDRELIGSDDRVLIYYSGHGKLQSLFGPQGESLKRGYIVPYDAKRDKTFTCIDMESIVTSCQECMAKHILLVLDCCYSGHAALRASQPRRPSFDPKTYLRDVTSTRAIQIIAAGLQDQPVNDSGRRSGYSAFTGALLDILESGIDLNHDGILSASEIGLYLESEVPKQAKGVAQKPVFNHLPGSALGDFVFGILK